jgi:hypothetical protein
MFGIVFFAARSFVKPQSAEAAWDSHPSSKARRMSERNDQSQTAWTEILAFARSSATFVKSGDFSDARFSAASSNLRWAFYRPPDSMKRHLCEIFLRRLLQNHLPVK